MADRNEKVKERVKATNRKASEKEGDSVGNDDNQAAKPVSVATNRGHDCTESGNPPVDKADETDESANGSSPDSSGDSVVTEVTATGETRRVDVTWKPPKHTPSGYKVFLYKIRDSKKEIEVDKSDEANPIEPTQSFYSFIELKSNTIYRCKVVPIYLKRDGNGTLSNAAETAPRVESPQERSTEFGKPKYINHETVSLAKDSATVILSWNKPNLGENYKLTGYRANLEQIWSKPLSWLSRSFNPNKFKKDLGPEENRTEIEKLAKGYEYVFTLYTTYKDCDNLKEIVRAKEFRFTLKPGPPIIEDCTCKDGVICFKWQPISSATKYCLTIKDEDIDENLVPELTNKVSKDERGCEAQVQMTDKLGIGRTCMTKVTVYYAENKSSVSEWKSHLIGGKKVAKNVKVARNTKNPQRALTISFDSPKDGPAKEYKVVAIPERGSQKTHYTASSPFVFEYLRKGVSYRFEVYAKWGESWSTPSCSNSISTEGQKSTAIIDIKAGDNASVDFTGAVFQGESTINNVAIGDDFGKVQGVQQSIKAGLNIDHVKLHWTRPNFGNKSSDYKVEKFKVEVRKQNFDEKNNYFVNFDKTKMEYSTEEYDLELGEWYDVSVSTIYEDIDQDAYFMSSSIKCQVNTRPCKPDIVRNDWKNDTLTIEWSCVRGAQRYEVELHKGNSSQPHITQVTESKFTRKFDETFGYGITYHCVVKAYGNENKFNQAETERRTIGGEYVPTDVSATINHPEVKDRNSQALLSWSAPQHHPEKYTVDSLPVASEMKIAHLEKEVCLVSGLKAGTHYYFKVIAIHSIRNEIKESGGCSSNRIQTNPTPTQVKNVFTRLGHNKSTSMEVFWDKVEAERDNETTKYKVCVERKDGSTKQKATVNTEKATFYGLEPGARYFVTVAGGNSIGFGHKSEKSIFKTDLGTPKQVLLKNNEKKPSTSLVVTFSDAEGDVLKYEGILYIYNGHVRHPIYESKVVHSGEEFFDLEPNSEYAIEVQAVTNSGAGKAVESNKMITAPSKAIITECGCSKQDGEWSSREIFAKWESDKGCDYHEVSVLRGESEHLENQLFVRGKNEVTYTCQYESTKYFVQVCAHNSSGHFGEPSNRLIVNLAPGKIEGVHAELTEDGYDIKVQCLKAQRHSPFYFMNAYCEGHLVTKTPLKQESQDVSIGHIEWIFTPDNFAKAYQFELWAEDSGSTKGKRAYTVPVTSRPGKGEVLSIEPLGSSPSACIQISWKEQDSCDAYEISTRIRNHQDVENQSRFSKTSCTYRCLCPGETYHVSVRAFCGSVWGFWSEEKSVTLAPAEIQLVEDQTEFRDPVESVNVEWEQPSVKPEGYFVKLFCDDVEVDQIKTEQTKHLFEGLFKPGSLCYCTVAGYNGDKIGGATKSRLYKILWTMPEHLQIDPDENEPTRKAKMKWDHPDGVTDFRLEIENNQTGVITTSFLSTARYVFESGMPGNTYNVRLFSGCDGRYDKNCYKSIMAMHPEPPTEIKVIANKKVNGLTIEFKDSVSTRKSYEVCVESFTPPEDKILRTIGGQSLTLRNLIPGEGYRVSVNTVVDSVKSNVLSTNGYIPTLPDVVKNLRSKIQNGSVVFEWDPLNIQPDEYIIQWRVDDQPISDQRTQMTSFVISRVKPAHWYHASVKASNHSGCGPMTPWTIFTSDPLPPTAVTVCKNEDSPETSLIVKFQDKIDPLKSYRVAALVDGEEVKVENTLDHYALLTDLTPGLAYHITVQTVFCEKISTKATYSRFSV